MNKEAYDLIVVGAGMAGMTAAAFGAERGLSVAVVSTGLGRFVFGAGSIPARAHPAPDQSLREGAIRFFQDFSKEADYPMLGALGQCRPLPTILGTVQQVALAPYSQWIEDDDALKQAAVVGIAGLSVFDAAFTAERLNANAAALGGRPGFSAHEIDLGLSNRPGQGVLHLAHRFDREPSFRDMLAERLGPIAAKAGLIVMPGILGLHSRIPELLRFESAVGARVVELPTLPPSIPGLRFSAALEARLRALGVEMFSGYPAKRVEIAGGQATAVAVLGPSRELRLPARAVVLAQGHFAADIVGENWSGLDAGQRPLGADGAPVAANLHLAGASMTSDAGQWGNEDAIVTGYRAAVAALGDRESRREH